MRPTLRSYAAVVVGLFYAPTVLAVAGASGQPVVQLALCTLTLALLLSVTLKSSRTEKAQLVMVLAGATGLELAATVWLGLYHYRFGVVPAFVVVGHALLFVMAKRLAASPLALLAARLTPWMAVTWAVLGLTAFPSFGGRLDVAGALCLPVLITFMWRSGQSGFYGLVFFGASFLEILGTALGDWTWAATTPYLGVPAGNPPSAIAGIYCLFYGLVLAATSAKRGIPATGPDRSAVA